MRARVFSRREVIALGGAAFAAETLQGASVDLFTFSVMSLLHPAELCINGSGAVRLHCEVAGRRVVLEPGRSLRVDASCTPVFVSGPEESATDFWLEAPGRLRRSYFGTLEISVRAGQLTPVVTMNIETAVGSIIGAELPAGMARYEAQCAQAVVARSFMRGTERPRHSPAQFCDTTHCQYLRDPARAGSLAALAIGVTRGTVLQGGLGNFPALYSAACGGSTEAGDENGFQYVSVHCGVCQREKNARRGHGKGLCQEGAMGLARQGWTGRAILLHYYPNATLAVL